MGDEKTLHQRWFEKHETEGEAYDPREPIFCGTEGCERDAEALIENTVGLAPLCGPCLSAYEFGAYGIEHPEYRERRREALP